MNKKEAAYVCSLRNELERMRALRWTKPVEPDVNPPVQQGVTYTGWIYCGDRVEPASSTSLVHSCGGITMKGARALYSTQLLALKALRHATELECAEKLRRIDLAISEVK
jgi:hypothetical protein